MINRFRVLHHHHGRTDKGNTLPFRDCLLMVLGWRCLLTGEWVAIEAIGSHEGELQFKRSGPFFSRHP